MRIDDKIRITFRFAQWDKFISFAIIAMYINARIFILKYNCKSFKGDESKSNPF